MAAYTDAAKIAAYLGVTLTSAQQTQAGIAAEAATAWIEEYKGQSWQTASPITDELHQILGDRVYLTHRPVTAVSAVKTREAYSDAGVTTLGTGSWELLDAENGVLLIQGWSSGAHLALVSYTHTMTSVPANVGMAATMIAAALLSQTLRPQTQGLESVSVGQNDVTVKFRADRGDVPKEALSLLGRRAIVIA